VEAVTHQVGISNEELIELSKLRDENISLLSKLREKENNIEKLEDKVDRLEKDIDKKFNDK